MNNKVVPLNWIDDTGRWIVIPGTIKEGRKKRIKELLLKKNNCYFARGVPKSIIDFTYRSIVKLKLLERTIIIIRGTVRTGEGLKKNSVQVKDLDWDVGTLITIPGKMRYREILELKIGNRKHSLKLMELSLLHGLLQVAFPKKNSEYYSAMAALVLSRGWAQLEMKKFPEIVRVS